MSEERKMNNPKEIGMSTINRKVREKQQKYY